MIIKITEQDRDYHDSVFTWQEELTEEEFIKRQSELSKRVGKDYYFEVLQ